MQNENFEDKIKGNPIALLPVAVFLVLYLGLGITFEYVLHISMGFYNIPIVAALALTGINVFTVLLVGIVATVNNTVAIVMAGPIAKQMGDEYRISPKKTASLLDIFSCVVQGILPYGAQMLVALAAISSALPNAKVSAFDLIPYMFYPFLLLVSVLVFIAISPRKNNT